MPLGVNISGVWKDDAQPYMNVGGVWKAGDLYHNVGGVWKMIYELFVNTLSVDDNTLDVHGISSSQQANVTSSVSTSFSWSLISGGGSGITFGPASGTTTYIRATNPASGIGSATSLYRVTATDGSTRDVSIYQEWDDGSIPP